MSAHTCHARGCDVVTPPSMFMCAPHWAMVPESMQRAVWRTFTRGQLTDLSLVSHEYLDAARAARDYVERETP